MATHSMVDDLAQHLSGLTGSTFTVRRGQGVLRYTIVAERQVGGEQFPTGALTISEAKSRLAWACDMVQMGFIPCSPSRAQRG